QFDSRFSQSGLDAIAPVLSTLKELAEKYEKTLSQIALNWLVAQENVIPIPGAKTSSQARQNAGAVGWALTPEEVTKLSEVSAQWRNERGPLG
ncbi:MAG: aldo/keto reductase, partial [Anaerolineae bacterium]|nr:aldo/keto reductase [Gloeobacterales cyanobacterium ES-bin-313]